MATLKVLDSEGKAKGQAKVSESLTVTDAGLGVLHRVVVAEEANRRQGTHSTKTRAEVRGGGRKPFRQKKTGRARQGSIRAPHLTHGGVAHGPKPRSYHKKVNRKERRLALRTAFASRVEGGDVIVVDRIEFEIPKTRDARVLLEKVGASARRVLVVLPECDDTVLKSFRNLPNVVVRTAPSAEGKVGKEGKASRAQPFSTRDLLLAHKIVVAKDALKAIEEAWS
ncbi:MAG: 50S ribosomal protein L4 [Armatimonadetes bacterium]|nr:50S ribosomal protein L4 [Armatimonadota bacterium]